MNLRIVPSVNNQRQDLKIQKFENLKIQKKKKKNGKQHKDKRATDGVKYKCHSSLCYHPKHKRKLYQLIQE